MIGQTILHYQILEKLGEVRKLPATAIQRVDAIFRISRCLDSAFAAGFQKAEPLLFGGSGRKTQ